MAKTTQDVLDVLNEVLTGELTAINQYFIHAKMCGDWGYDKLHQKVRHESIDEMKHAEALMERILYLGGIPNVQRLGKINVGETVEEQLKLDLALENEAVPRLRDGINICVRDNDFGSRSLLEGILVSEEEHIDWLEAQLELIDQIGINNYLSQQIHGE
ncbi:MAG: bacterioferritin [Myxococcales bacterium]|nr:bacterioferritin [Myxococcales bacterium]|tara:strand:- start:734 stop:1210 length:477 start_codon:yes stop_codon:yes gene_type:complete